MHEVKIIAEFTTGTTVSNPDDAKETVRKIFLEGLKNNNFAAENSNYIFSVKILRMESESLFKK